MEADHPKKLNTGKRQKSGLEEEEQKRMASLSDKLQHGYVAGDFEPGVNVDYAKGAKIGVIDLGCCGELTNYDLNWFQSLSISEVLHDKSRCTHTPNATFSPHGYSCASIIGCKRRDANFYGVCETQIQGVVPSAHIYAYPVSCGQCVPTLNLLEDAFNKAIEDGVKVISMSLGLGVDYTRGIENRKQDIIGMKTLDAIKNKVLPCLALGNDGPVRTSAQYALPWCMTVGACTSGQVTETEIEIATYNINPFLETANPENREFIVIDKLKGKSLNVIESQFLLLRVDNIVQDIECECFLYANKLHGTCYLNIAEEQHLSLFASPEASSISMALLSKEEAKRLWQLHVEHEGQLYVKITKSKFQNDQRGVLVANFSSRGPSPSNIYQDIMTPDVIAPGYSVLMSHPKSIALNYSKSKIGEEEALFSDCNIASGTSFSCPQVAAYALIVYSKYPEWLPSAVKSALITTAQSFTVKGVPGDEFEFGAGSININNALSPGLVYEDSWEHFQEYVDKKREIYDLNLPTFASSFPHSSQSHRRIFRRELKNVGEGKTAYKFEVHYFNRTLDTHVKINAHPDYLVFERGEKKKFELSVEIVPHPWGHVSAMIMWIPDNGGQHVCSPIHLYHHSKLDKPVWYR